MLPTFSKNLNKAASAAPREMRAGLSGRSSTRPDKKRDLRVVLAIFVFIISLLATGGAFAANWQLNRQIVSIEQTIEQYEADIQLGTIENLIRFNQGIEALKVLVNSRRGYLVLVEAIASIVVPQVIYTSAAIELDSERAYTLTIQATADSLEAYRLQVHELRKLAQTNHLLNQIAITNYEILTDQETRTMSVTFTLEISIPVDTVVDSVRTNNL